MEQNKTEYPLISVVVPVYNAEAFLERTVGSILAQTYPNLEILLVNDGSGDRSLAICHELEKRDARIRVFDKENGGASTARNVGIRNAKGRYIGFVDSDDLILPDMYRLLYEGAMAAEQYLQQETGKAEEKGKEEEPGKTANTKGKDDTGAAFIVQIGREEIDEAGNRLADAVKAPKEAQFVSPTEFAESLLMYTGDASFCTSMLPAAYMKEHLFPEGVMGEDFILLMRMSESIRTVLRLPQTGYRVVHRAGSATRTGTPAKFSRVYIDIVRHADEVENVLAARNPQLKAAALRFGLYERLDYMLHVPIRDMNRGNAFYEGVLQYLRRNFNRMLRCDGLTAKNKVYLALLTVAPRLVRRVHWALRHKKMESAGVNI